MPDTNKIKIDYATDIRLKKIVLNHLGISNLNKLRDRFEGQSYLNGFLMKAYSEIALERFLELQLIDKTLRETKKNYTPEIYYNGLKLRIISFTIDDYPRIPNNEFDLGIFVRVNLEDRRVEILGFLDFTTIKSMSIKELISPIQSKQYIGGIKDLSILHSPEELKEVSSK